MGLCVFCSSVFFCEKKYVILLLSLCHYVFKTIPCLPLSLCHSVLKTTPVSHRPSVILSSRPPLLLLLSSCYSVFKITLSPLSSCYSVLKNYPVSPRPPVILSSRNTLSGYLYYYIYPACDRLFCVVPLHRHQE